MEIQEKFLSCPSYLFFSDFHAVMIILRTRTLPVPQLQTRKLMTSESWSCIEFNTSLQYSGSSFTHILSEKKLDF